VSVTGLHGTIVGDSEGEAVPPGVIEELSTRYEILSEAGRGGMATVWLALRRTDGARVALKILRPGIARALGPDRFLREIRIATAVRAPTLMPLEESGDVDGNLYYVMPFAEGGTLRQRLDASPQLPVDEAIRITRRIATGAGALHAEGFVHRDIKPENVLLDADGSARLADYGIARALQSVASDLHTSTGMVLGTPSYMSPEQAGGESVDGRSDIYAIGCVLYEMLAGTPPFVGASAMAVISRHMNEPPPPIRIVRSTVTDGLAAVVTRALAKVPADRYQDVPAFLDALDAATGAALGASSFAEPRTSIRRQRGALALLGTAAVVVLSGIAYWRSTRQPELDATRVVVLPFTETDRSRSIEGDNMTILVGSALERTETSRWLDGVSLMSDAERSAPRAVSADRALSLARQVKAGFVVDGVILRRGDSTAVAVRLIDVKTGTVLRQVNTTAPDSVSITEIALRSIVQILPALTGMSEAVDVSALVGHDAAAVDSWLRGERAFRSTQMDSALRLLERAVAQDSTLAPAAFRAAIAASWTNRTDKALTLVRLALRHPEALTNRQRPFAVSLERFLAGRADEALVRLRPVLTEASESAEAWMLAGEIHYHLLPTIGIDSLARRAIPPPVDWPLETFAHDAFLRAQQIDSGFSPPLAHLAEIAARHGDAAAAARYAARATGVSHDSAWANQMRLTTRCLGEGPTSVDWASEVRRGAATVFRVAAVLQSSTDPRPRRCAMAAFAAILAGQPVQAPEYWTSLLGLHAMLIAQADVSRALAIVDTAVANGLPQAVGLFVLDATAGIDVGGRATSFVRQLESAIATRGPPSLWLLSLEAARMGDEPRLRDLQAILRRRAGDTTATRLDSLMLQTAGAYLAVARHDTVKAIAILDALVPTAAHREVEYSLWESLAPERILQCRLLLARGRYADAARLASLFDQPNVFVHQLFLPASLEIRARAANAMGDRVRDTRFRDRLTRLRSVVRP